MSAVLTVSLEGYLDDKRISYGSPPDSELHVALQARPCSEESFPVFSPLPVFRQHPVVSADSGVLQGSNINMGLNQEIAVPTEDPSDSPDAVTATTTNTATTVTTTSTSHTLQPGGVQMRQHRRQSSINTVSWTDQGDSTSVRPLSYNLDPSEVRRSYFESAISVLESNVSNVFVKETSEQEPVPAVTLRRRPSHRRQSSAAISWSRFEDTGSTGRRDSFASSWMRDDPDYEELSTRAGPVASSRPYSWGPVGEFFYRESLSHHSDTDRSLFSHHVCTLLTIYIRYYWLLCSKLSAVYSTNSILINVCSQKTERIHEQPRRCIIQIHRNDQIIWAAHANIRMYYTTFIVV